MNVKEETHFVCGICGGCYHDSEESAKECCNTELKRLHNGVSEEEFKEKSLSASPNKDVTAHCNSPKSCFLTGCEHNTGAIENKCKINAVTDDGLCGRKTS